MAEAGGWKLVALIKKGIGISISGSSASVLLLMVLSSHLVAAVTMRYYNQVIQSDLFIPCWRSLNHLKGSLNHPKKVTKNCQEFDIMDGLQV